MSRNWRGSLWMYKILHKSRNTVHSPILNSSILMGRVMPSKSPVEKAARFDPQMLMREDTAIEVRVPYNVYDAYFKGFFEHQWDFVAEDPSGKLDLKTGDTVLLKRLEDAPNIAGSLSLRDLAESRWWEDKKEIKEWWEDTKPEQKPITHHVIEKIYSIGDVKDPITGQMVVGEQYREQLETSARLYGESVSEDSDKFSYKKAPKRGWQEGKRDFTQRKTYRKWHVFKKEDKYGLIS